eukprot:gene7336-9348_t
MSDEEWERAYRDAHRSFYSWDHMERILRRMAALGSNKKKTTVNRLLAYREAVRLEGVAKLESGYVRIKRRTQRRPGLPRENVFAFWTGYGAHLVHALGGSLVTYARLYRMMRRIVTDPDRFAYRDRAISADTGDGASPLIADTRATDHSQRRTARAIALLALDWAIFASLMVATVLLSAWWAKLLCGLAAGFMIGRLFIIGHDACHQSYTPHRGLNRVLGRIAMLPSLTPYSLWEVGHNVVHHGYTNLK